MTQKTQKSKNKSSEEQRLLSSSKPQKDDKHLLFKNTTKIQRENLLALYNPDKKKISEKLRKFRTWAVTLALFVFLIIDLFYHDKFMQKSCEFTSKLQKINGSELLSKVLSSLLTYWVIGLFVYLKLLNHDIRFVSWLIFVWAAPIGAAAVMKAIWARGRPFFLCQSGKFEIWKCVNEFGFPSSHATMGISVYYILYKFLENVLDSKFIVTKFSNFDILRIKGGIDQSKDANRFTAIK